MIKFSLKALMLMLFSLETVGSNNEQLIKK